MEKWELSYTVGGMWTGAVATANSMEIILKDSEDNDPQANSQGTQLNLLQCYSDVITILFLMWR